MVSFQMRTLPNHYEDLTGVTNLGQHHVLVLKVGWGAGSGRGGGPGRAPSGRESPKGGEPENFALFVPSPATIFSFFPLLVCFRGIFGV